MATLTMNFSRLATGESTGTCDSDGYLDYENTGSNQSFANYIVNSIKITFDGICTNSSSSGARKLIVALEDSNNNRIQIYKDRDNELVLPEKYTRETFTVYATDNLSSLTGRTICDMWFECGDGEIFTFKDGTCTMVFDYTVQPTVAINSFTVTQNNNGTATASWKGTLNNASGNISYTLTANGKTYSATGASGVTKSQTIDISTDLSYGTSHTFKLEAKYSGAPTVSSSKSITFVKPSISTPTLSLSGNVLSWNAASFSSFLTGTKSYELYKDGSSFKTLSALTLTLSSDVVKDWGAGTFTITVKAVGTGLSNTDAGSTIYSESSNGVTYTITITRCTAPTYCAVKTPLSHTSSELEWSGESSGSNNSITGYNIRYCESKDGSTFGDWSDPIFIASSPATVSPPDSIGNYYKFEVQTCGSAGSDYYSETWTPSSNMLRRDMAAFSSFTDPTLQAGITKPKAVHMTELHDLINGLFEFHHMNEVEFSGITSQQTSLLDWKDHVVEIRNAVDLFGDAHEAWVAIPNGLPSAAVIDQIREILYGYYENRDTRS